MAFMMILIITILAIALPVVAAAEQTQLNCFGKLTELFSNTFTNSIKNLSQFAMFLLITLAGIDIVLAILLNIDEIDYIKLLVKKTLTYGFYICIVINYDAIIKGIMDGFMWIGNEATKGTISTATLQDPIAMIGEGVKMGGEMISSISFGDVFSDLGGVILLLIAALIVMISFIMLGIEFFVTYVEFYIMASLAFILIPFGVNEHTKFISEKVNGLFLTIGAKLMVITFIAGIVSEFVTKKMGVTDPLDEALGIACVALTILVLTIKVPKLAMQLMSSANGGLFSAAGVAAGVGATAKGAGVVGKAAVVVGKTAVVVGKTAGKAAVVVGKTAGKAAGLLKKGFGGGGSSSISLMPPASASGGGSSSMPPASASGGGSSLNVATATAAANSQVNTSNSVKQASKNNS